jgi:hypothetical protein
MNVQKPPTSYADWVACFEQLQAAKDDEALLALISKGKVPWSSSIAQRFADRLTASVSARLKGAVAQFSRSIERSRGEESAVVQAMLSLRRHIRFLYRFVSDPVFPPEIRDPFANEIEKQAKQLHETIINNVKKDLHGRLLHVVQYTPLFVKDQPITPSTPIPLGRSKRRIIIDE